MFPPPEVLWIDPSIFGKGLFAILSGETKKPWSVYPSGIETFSWSLDIFETSGLSIARPPTGPNCLFAERTDS